MGVCESIRYESMPRQGAPVFAGAETSAKGCNGGITGDTYKDDCRAFGRFADRFGAGEGCEDVGSEGIWPECCGHHRLID